MRTLLVLFLIFGWSELALAQNLLSEAEIAEPTTDQISRKGDFYLGVTPTALLNLYPGIQVNATYFTSDQWYLQSEFGYLSSFFQLNNEYSNVKGARFRLTLERSTTIGKDGFVGFIGGGIHARFIQDSEEPSRQYWDDHQLIVGPVMMIGLQKDVQRFRLRLGGGFGVGYCRGCTDTIWFSGRDQSFNYPIVIMHFAVQYRL